MKSIRNQYDEFGAETYYLNQGADYKNPHFLQVRALLIQNSSKLDFSKALDLSCGSGEVSSVLKEMGFPIPQASDPFTQQAYAKNFPNHTCWHLSFEDIIKGKLQGQYSTIICSFAMHLCAQNQLFPLVQNLFLHTNTLVIITPHKRPELENLDFVDLTFIDYVFTDRGKKVFLKAYSWTL